jgi:hypothetical protein
MTKLASQLAMVVTPTALARMLFCMISTGLGSATFQYHGVRVSPSTTSWGDGCGDTHMTQESGPMQDEKPRL